MHFVVLYLLAIVHVLKRVCEPKHDKFFTREIICKRKQRLNSCKLSTHKLQAIVQNRIFQKIVAKLVKSLKDVEMSRVLSIRDAELMVEPLDSDDSEDSSGMDHLSDSSDSDNSSSFEGIFFVLLIGFSSIKNFWY